MEQANAEKEKIAAARQIEIEKKAAEELERKKAEQKAKHGS